jgi:hypothetical protein
MTDLTPRVKITVTADCGHVVFEGYDSIAEKYPFWCDECGEDRREGKYPWSLAAQIVYEPGRYEDTTSGRVWIPA